MLGYWAWHHVLLQYISVRLVGWRASNVSVTPCAPPLVWLDVCLWRRLGAAQPCVCRLARCLQHTSNVTHVDASGNNLTQLPDTVWQLPRLEVLDLSRTCAVGLATPLTALATLTNAARGCMGPPYTSVRPQITRWRVSRKR